jgi:hypothetical protein
MRLAIKDKGANRGPVSTVTSVPAPVGGWNARESLADMPPEDAVILKNWFPSTSELILRFGHTQYSTGYQAQVETVMTYNGPTSSKLFGISSGNVYDATSGGAIGAAALSGLANSRWEYVNVATTGGNYLMMVNGADAPYTYDGSSWANPAITGVTTTNLSNINLHKNRVWFVERNTLKAWYLGTGAIAGAANQLDLSSVAQLGGNLVAMATWTIDAGYGVDDLAVFITSEGEIIVYRGTNPASAADWLLVGVFRIGTPIGKRCWIKLAGDLLIITQDGVVPLSGALQSSRLNPRVAITDKIQRAVSDAVSSYGANFGWQLVSFPKENMAWLNVPISEGSGQEQYVMNTINKSWCQFTGWDANCWTIYNDDPYFGGNGFVGKAWNTNSDNGSNINADALPAFNYFGSRGRLKRYTMARPMFRTNGSPSLQVSMNVDFDTSDLTSPLSFSPTTYAAWDSAVWDTDVWGGGLSILKNWQSVNGIGYCAAPRMIVACSGIEVAWVSTDFVMEQGGVL